MALTRYVQETSGVLYGTRREVLDDLQSRKLNVIFLTPDFLTMVNMTLFSKKFNSKQMSIFFKDFGNMLETGLTLPHILNALREQTLDSHLATLYIDMNKKLKEGESLSVCFKATDKFPDLVISVVSAGEHAGHLPLTMKILSEYYSALDDMKGKFLGALGYPFVVVVVLFIALIYMSINVIPPIRAILPPESLNSFTTVFMLGLANFAEHFWFLMLLFPFLLMGLFIYMKQSMKDKFDVFLFKIPYLGHIFRDYEISVVFLSIWVLHKAGIPIDSVLRKVIEANRSYSAKQLKTCREALVGGYAFSETLKLNPFFPRLISDTVRLGEEMGRYNEYFERIYRFYRDAFQTRLKTLIVMVEPAMIIFCGLFIFLVIVAFLKPIYGNLGNIGASTMK